jgi:flagellar assembly protein FliH
MNPADIAVLAAQGVTQGIGVELVPDSSLKRGDAMAQYPEGWLDARLGTALARACTALLEDQP